MRILWLSNAEWAPSGYGEQTFMFCRRLQALGHDVAIAANYGLQASTMEWDGILTYPASGNWGNDKISTFARHHEADLVIALCDAWVMKPKEWPDLNVAIWAPLDHYPIPPAVREVLIHERVSPISMSHFGHDWMKRAGMDPVYVPHGVDTKLHRPQPELKSQVRKELEIPEDAYVVGMVAANKGNPAIPRKGWPQAFDAFAEFSRRNKDAFLYVHSTMFPIGHDGIDLNLLALGVGIQPDRVRFTPESAWLLGTTRHAVSRLYQAFDVLLNPSMGEGFGIPILEAQANGVPVIASDHSAMTELTQAGWLVTGDRWWDALQSSFLIMPSITSILNALEASYEQRDNQELRDGAREFAMMYDADRVTLDFWVPALEKLAVSRSKPREVAPLQPNRAARRKAARSR
jgi:glycosyltransferase involved in cell wall biosynthesis